VAPHRTGAIAHALADIVAYQAGITGWGRPHGNGADNGVAECGNRESCDEDERGASSDGAVARAPLSGVLESAALRIACARLDARRQRLADLADLSVDGDAVAAGCADRRHMMPWAPWPRTRAAPLVAWT
jgi:hypothetical protein